MLIVNKKEFAIGSLMSIGFFLVLAVMFSPISNGKNAFELSDELFNSISKGSTNYIAKLQGIVDSQEFKPLNLTVDMKTPELAQRTASILDSSANVTVNGSVLQVAGGLKAILNHAITDSKAMFYNNDSVLKAAYDMSGKQAMFVWWQFLNAAEKEMKQQSLFVEAKTVHSVITRGVEVGYNYYGIKPEKASDTAFILSGSLIFYVIYTLWWGYAIFFLVEGMGLSVSGRMKH